MRIVGVAIFVALIVAVIDAQFDPIKVGEYRSSSNDSEQLAKEVKSFVERLAKEPKSTQGAIALINGMKFAGPCVDGRRVEDKSFANAIQASIPKRYWKRIVLVPSDYWSIRGEADFYLVPKRAALPRKMERTVQPPCCCSEISIGRSEGMDEVNKLIKFTLVLTEESVKTPPNPVWTVSAGRISSGQGTKSIEVEFGDAKVDTVVVEVAITPPDVTCGCPVTASLTVRISGN